MRGLTRLLSGLLTLSFVVMLLIAGGAVWFQQAVNEPGPLKEIRNIVIPAGDSSRMIADRLEQQGAISGQTLFLAQMMSQTAISRVSGRPAQQLKAGEYELSAGMSIREIIEKLSEGRSLLYSVTVPEGLTSHEVVRRLLNDPNLSGAISQVPAEGSLMPETLRVPRNTSRSQVLAMLAREQTKYLEQRWQQRLPDIPLSTKDEALVLASIVEKESGPKDDPARIAGVFINRLRRGMRLQSDPTILYGKHGPTVQWGDTIYRSDINRKTAYNTYQIDGLPPTPICNPGRRSIEAVMQPAVTNDLFFVANGQGGHVFSETLKDHDRAVREWRKIERDIRSVEEKQNAGEKSAAPTEAAATIPVATVRSGAADVAPTLLNTKIGARTVGASSEVPVSETVPLPVKRPARQ